MKQSHKTNCHCSMQMSVLRMLLCSLLLLLLLSSRSSVWSFSCSSLCSSICFVRSSVRFSVCSSACAWSGGASLSESSLKSLPMDFFLRLSQDFKDQMKPHDLKVYWSAGFLSPAVLVAQTPASRCARGIVVCYEFPVGLL